MARSARRLLAVVALAAASSASGLVQQFALSGACSSLSAVNGLNFILEGMTARNTPYYKAVGADEWVYHDDDCDASSDGTPKWILSGAAPDPSRQADLDHDGRCFYQAYVVSAGVGTSSPPLNSQWQMLCNYEWTAVALALTHVVTQTTSTVTTRTTTTTEPNNATTTTAPTNALRLSGACATKDFLNDVVFVRMGNTANGAPYYRSVNYQSVPLYIYYDEDCSVSGDTARWIVDSSAPSTTRQSDLDGDHACDYHARAISGNHAYPPTTATWRMYCSDQWTDQQLTLTPVEVLENATATTAWPTTRPREEALVMSGAAALWPLGVLPALAPLLW